MFVESIFGDFLNLGFRLRAESMETYQTMSNHYAVGLGLGLEYTLSHHLLYYILYFGILFRGL